jgi:signal transduction histidine kinase
MPLRGLRAFLRTHRRLLLLAALCAALSALAGFYFIRSLFKPDTGLVVGFPEVIVDAGRVVFSPKAPFSAAVASGLLPVRDEILAVGGQAVHTSRDILLADARIRGFAPFPVDVLRDGADRRTIMIAPVFTPTRPDWIFVLAFCIVLVSTAVLLTVRQPDAGGTVLIVLASLFYLVFTCVKPFYYENLFANCLIHLGKLTPWLLVAFGLFFPSRRGTPGLRAALITVMFAAYAAFFGARIVLYVRWIGDGTEAWLAGYRLLGQIGNAAEGGSYVAWGSLMASAYLRARTQKEKTQLRWILAGILVALPPYFFLDQLPIILGQPAIRMSLGNIAPLFLSFIPVCILIGLTRHRVFSLRAFVTRVIVSAALFLLMGALFAVLYLPLRGYVETGYRLGSPAAELVTTALIFAALVPLRSAGLRLADRVTLRRPSATRSELERRNAELLLIVEELDRKGRRRLQGRRLADLRSVLHGIAGGLREPARRVAASLTALRAQLSDLPEGAARAEAERAIAPGLEGSVRIAEILRAVESLTGPSAAISAQVNAETLVRSAIERARQKHPSARFSAVLACDARLSCYTEELIQALCDVLSNAAEAQEGLAEPVRVRLTGEDGRLVIEVEDSGPGIDESARRKLFTPFRTTKQGHQGLGLYFARIIVERNDGSIELGPGQHGGALARFVFPIEGAG